MQGVNAVLPAGQTTARAAAGSTEKSSICFEDCIVQAGNAGSTQNASYAGTETAQVSSGTDSRTGSNVSAKKMQQSTVQKRQDVQETSVDPGQVSQTDDLTQTAAAGGILEQADQEIRTVLQDALGLDEETFQNALDAMGITAVELLNSSVLRQFIMQLGGSGDMTDFLTDESMMDAFVQGMDALQSIDWSGLTVSGNAEMLSGTDGMQETLRKWLQALSDPGNTQQTETDARQAGMFAEESMQALSDAEGLQDMVSQTADMSLTEKELRSAAESAQAGTQQTGMQRMTEQTSQSGSTVQDSTVLSEAQMQTQTSFDGAQAQQNAWEQAQAGASQTEDAAQILPENNTTVTQFVENMVQAAAAEEQVSQPVEMQQMIDIVNQVVERIRSSMQEGTTTLEMQLNPERLGRLYLSVSSKEGVMTASFTVQTAEAKAALESQIITLRENLEQKNLKVEAVEVSVSDFAFSQNSQADGGDQKDFRHGNGRRARFRYDDGEEEAETREIEAEQVRQSVMRDNGSSVDFTA